MRTATSVRLLFIALALSAGQAQAQGTNPSRTLTMATTPAATAEAGTAPTIVNTMTLKGRVESLTGVLRGAVVTLQGQKSVKAVTDADGFFSLVVPSTDQPVAVTASFAGFEDVNATLTPGTQPAVVRLTVSHEVKVSRQNQLKKYLKTARKQVKKQLRQMPRS